MDTQCAYKIDPRQLELELQGKPGAGINVAYILPGYSSDVLTVTYSFLFLKVFASLTVFYFQQQMKQK